MVKKGKCNLEVKKITIPERANLKEVEISRLSVLAVTCYIVMGWSILVAARTQLI
jgi:hypothetical protein